MDDRAKGTALDNGLRQVRGEVRGGAAERGASVARGRYADLGGQLDRAALGRAQEAYNEIIAAMWGMVDAILRDPSLTREQKAAAVASLKARKVAEAKAVRKRMMDEEKAKSRGGRGRGGRGKGPKPDSPTVH